MVTAVIQRDENSKKDKRAVQKERDRKTEDKIRLIENETNIERIKHDRGSNIVRSK